jgi:hypothetical protein
MIDLTARICRFEELTHHLHREAILFRKGEDPLLFLERRAYLSALDEAIGG